MYSTYKQKDPNTEYLEWELEREREHRQQLEEGQERRREERRKEREERWYYQQRTAETWPEALRKQASLMAAEAAQWPDDLAEQYPDDYFGPGTEACNRALEIWETVEASKQGKIIELKKQLEAVQDEIRLEVAQTLRAENDISGWQHVADAIENDEDLTTWLNW